MTQRRLNAGGFSLLETLVALAILSLSLGVIYQSQSHSVRAIGRGLGTQEALLRAETIMAEHTGALAQQSADQLAAVGMPDQQVQKRLLDLPPLAPGWPTVTMYQVNVVVSDSSRAGGAVVRLSTLDSP
jgi:prepilin-type N-terminal cleavage/methylation domain-containing protein